MRDDVYWTDGEPVTVDDLIFTWEAISDPEGGIWAEGIDYTDSIEKINDYTFVVHYSTVYPNYQLQFGGENFGVWPEHYCGMSQGFVSWDCNREPLSNALEHLTKHPWLAIFPGLMIFLAIISINYIGDGLRDAFDPHKVLKQIGEI